MKKLKLGSNLLKQGLLILRGPSHALPAAESINTIKSPVSQLQTTRTFSTMRATTESTGLSSLRLPPAARSLLFKPHARSGSSMANSTIGSFSQTQIRRNLSTNGSSSSSTNMLRLLGTAAAGSILISGFENKKSNDQAITCSDDMNFIYHQMLIQLLHGKENNSVTSLSKAINGAVSNGDQKTFETELDRLIELEPKISEKYFELLINTCAAQGKVSLLRSLNDKFNLRRLIITNTLAVSLLQHPAASEIERLSSEFSLGQIKHEGSNLQLAHQKRQDLQMAQDRLGFPLTTGLEVSDDLWVMMSFCQAQASAEKEINTAYNSLVVLPGDDLDVFERYLGALKQLASKENTVNSVFLTYAGHFTSGQILIDQTTNGNFSVKLVYIDSLGSSEGYFAAEYLLNYFEATFPQQMNYFVSDLKVQNALRGCSVFSLMNVHDLIHYNNIFDYLDCNTTRVLTTSSHNKQSVSFSYQYKTALLPLLFSRGKETMTHRGEITLVDHENHTIVGGVKCPIRKTIQSIGYMGLPLEIENSSEERKKEADLPIGPYTPQTINEWIAEYVRKNAQNKDTNFTTSLLVFQWRMQIVRWLVSLKPEEIAEQSELFSLPNFISRNGLPMAILGDDKKPGADAAATTNTDAAAAPSTL